LVVSRKAHLILPTHRLLDAVSEHAKGKDKIGSTLKGISPAYTDKVSRNGMRIGDIESDHFKNRYLQARERHMKIIVQYDIDYQEMEFDGLRFHEYEKAWLEALDVLRNLKKVNSEYFLNKALKDGKTILAEGAQGTLLDIDFGSYPFVTSSNTITAGVCSGLGIPPTKVGKVYGIFKAYCTRVGSGPFPTELHDENGNLLRDYGKEFGSTTGRPRRCGWLDLPALKYAIMLNGVTELMMMKADVLNSFSELNVAVKYEYNGQLTEVIPFESVSLDIKPELETLKGWNQEIKVSDIYNDLPVELKEYVAYIESEVGIPITIVSVGPDRTETIFK
jgi:adenylosuccinate synthase